MRSYARVRKLTEEEYQELKRWERSRTMAAEGQAGSGGAVLEPGLHLRRSCTAARDD